MMSTASVVCTPSGAPHLLREACETGVRRMRRAGFATMANHRLSARSTIAKAQRVSPGASRGRSHAIDGWPMTATQGLRAAWTTTRSVGERLQGDTERERGVRREAPNTPQRNGFTAVRKANNDPPNKFIQIKKITMALHLPLT
jgi:hypothetical protein